MGNSAGVNATREAQSASTRARPPPATLAGSSQRWLAPNVMRARCGTTSPTKTMLPVTATSGPMMSALASTRRTRSGLSA